MTTIEFHDSEFGAIAVRCNPRAKRVILRLSHQGDILLTIPRRMHLPLAKKLLDDNRPHLRRQQASRRAAYEPYQPGQLIGKHHQLIFRARAVEKTSARIGEETIVITYPFDDAIETEEVQSVVRPAIKKALRRQAEAYLPTRLQQLSQFYQLPYESLRLSSGHTRWGSCSSSKRISLNIWLMTLPYELIDYVICHELCHTVQHNHSSAFWQLVAAHMPGYKGQRKLLKAHHPAG